MRWNIDIGCANILASKTRKSIKQSYQDSLRHEHQYTLSDYAKLHEAFSHAMDRFKHSGLIGNVTVSSVCRYVVHGSVRGFVSQHRTLDAAIASKHRDAHACKERGGHSDCSIYMWNNGRWTSCEVAAVC